MDKAMQSSKFWDRLANRYARTAIGNEDAYQKKLEITRSYLRPEMQVLEFGCGTGTTAIAHAPFVGEITAIDFSAKMLAIARDKASEAGIENVCFVQSGIEEFADKNQKFDAIMGHSILHLLADRNKVISKVFDLLKPGGVFISSTACMGNKMKLIRWVFPLGRALGLLPLVKFFSVEELVAGMEQAGFEIDRQWQPEEGGAVFIVAKKPA